MQTQTAFIKVECPNRSLAIRLWWDQSFASLWHLKDGYRQALDLIEESDWGY